MPKPYSIIIDNNSLLEIYFDHLKSNIPKIEIDLVGKSKFDATFGFYTVIHPLSKKFCIAGTDLKIYNDNRRKNLYKKRTSSTIFIFLKNYPQISEIYLKKMFRDINSNQLELTEYVILSDILEVTDIFKSND